MGNENTYNLGPRSFIFSLYLKCKLYISFMFEILDPETLLLYFKFKTQDFNLHYTLNLE